MSIVQNIVIALLFICVPALVWALLRVQKKLRQKEQGYEDPIDLALSEKKSAASHTPLLTQSDALNRISRAAEEWVLKRRFTDPTLTISEALHEMDITASELSLYIQVVHNLPGYRQWIAQLRIEEAKRQIIENPNYTFDAIALMCGISNGSALARAFKTQTGLTPSEWADQQRKALKASL